MYRTNDPRFRRRLNEIGQTLENANETAQSGIYIFGQNYIKPCFQTIGSCITDCVDANCPTLSVRNRDRIRRQRGQPRSGGRAELSFDFYDDWDEEENDGLLGWGNDEFDRLLAGSGGYGTVTNAQPARQRGMSYPKTRRKSAHDIEHDPTIIAGGSGFFNRLFGGRPLRYKPSAAGLQEHPGARHQERDMAQGEGLLDESEASEAGGRRRRSTRNRSGTAGSRETQDSYSSRGDLFASDDEEDAVPIDEEFAMVLERRTTNSGNVSGHDTGSDQTGSPSARRSKRPSAASRRSSRRTTSSKHSRGSGPQSRASSYTALATREIIQSPDHDTPEPLVPSLHELQQEDERVAEEEEAEFVRRRKDAEDLAEQQGLVGQSQDSDETAAAGQGRANADPVRDDEPSQLPTPVPTDDEASEGGAPPEPT